MNSNSADNKNEELGENLSGSGSSKNTEPEQPTDARAEAVPLEDHNSVPSVNGNPVADINPVSDVKSFESHSIPLQEPPSISLDASADTDSADPDIQPSAAVKAKSLEAPNTKEGITAQTDNVISTNFQLPPSSKVEAPANSNVETPCDSKAEAPTDTTADPPADSADPDIQPSATVKAKALEVPNTKQYITAQTDNVISTKSQLPPSSKMEATANSNVETPLNSKAKDAAASKAEAPTDTTADPPAVSNAELPADSEAQPATPKLNAASSNLQPKNANDTEIKYKVNKTELPTPAMNEKSSSVQLFLLDGNYEGSESGTEEEQSAFMDELENFFRERSMEFKPPKFYGEGLNCLKLWRAVTRLGGYDKVTSCKLWRQVGESFKPPKTCTTVSWTFRGFYEKALLDYERHKTSGGELSLPVASQSEPMNIDNQASGSGRARRDAAARAMQGWHSQRVLGNEVSDPIIKDKNHQSLQKREKQLKSPGLLKRKKPSYMELAVKAARTKTSKSQLDVAVVDLGPPADWVKINVQRTNDCFEVYALVPGLLREEVRVQSDPAGRLVISGEPEHPDNPWGITPFKKVVSLPARIDPHQTSAVVTLHGQLFVRVPFEQSD